MKRFLAVLLVSTLAFAFSSKAQTLYEGLMPLATGIQVNDGLTSGEITSLTTAGTYTSFGTITGTALPSTSPGNRCTGSIYACDLYVLIPSGKSATNTQIFAGLKDKLTDFGWQGCGVEFTFTITLANGTTFDATAKWFCKNSLT